MNFLVTKYDYDASGNPKYIGMHTTENAPETDENWRIKKFEFDASGNLVVVKKLIGVYAKRATLHWG